eukprot:IDg15901t1
MHHMDATGVGSARPDTAPLLHLCCIHRDCAALASRAARDGGVRADCARIGQEHRSVEGLVRAERGCPPLECKARRARSDWILHDDL